MLSVYEKGRVLCSFVRDRMKDVPSSVSMLLESRALRLNGK